MDYSKGRKNLEIRSRSIRQFKETLEGPELDRDLFEKATKDLERHADYLGPIELWDLSCVFKERPERVRQPTFGDMLPLWIGGKAMVEVSEEILGRYRGFFEVWDFLQLLPSYLREEIGQGYERRVADLGTIIDLNLIIKHLETFQKDHLYILEVGGGYGRLAEAFLGIYGDQVKYVLVDAVPGSLVYADLYLRMNFPERPIGFYYRGDEFNLDEYDCYIAPSFYFEKLNNYKFDVSINIASMQEMSQQQIDYFLDLFNRVTTLRGQIYLSNSRDYRERKYKYPSNWRLMFRKNTPRSWTPYYPVEIFCKTDRDCAEEEGPIATKYLRELCAAYEEDYRERTELIREKRKYIEKLGNDKKRIVSKNLRLKSKNEKLISSIDKLKEDNSSLKLRNQRLITSVNKLKERNSSLKLRNQRLITSVNKLKERNSSLKLRNQRLITSVNKLKERNSSLKLRNQRLITSINMLKNRNEMVISRQQKP